MWILTPPSEFTPHYLELDISFVIGSDGPLGAASKTKIAFLGGHHIEGDEYI